MTADPFSAERPRLLGLAYRILGSLVDAEDVVQEAWLRWSTADQSSIERPAAWLTTVTTRLALDVLRAARRQRESYVGPWLAEPIVTAAGPANEVEEAVETAETLTLGFLAILEQLDPVARAVFLLTDVFGYSGAEVANAVGRSPAACRQIASRARRRVQSYKPHRPSLADAELAARLLAAVSAGDTEGAMALMSEDVSLVTDGGPTRHAARRPVLGPWRVTRFLVNISKRMPAGSSLQPAMINGAVGFVLRTPDGSQDSAIALDAPGGKVSAIWVVNNPEKLTHLSAPADLV